MWLLLINPTSGGGNGKKIGEEIANFLNQHHVAHTDISGSSFESALTNLRLALTNPSSGVIAVGGDGMVHLAIQALAGSRIPLVIIPAGTGNDFARSLSLPLDKPLEIMRKALLEEPRAIDLGKVNDRWFADILSTGFDSLVNERANRFRWIRGKIKYNIAILMELPLFKPKEYSFRVDGVEFQTHAMLIAIGNGSCYGGGMKVCPDARFDDGLFDLMILGPISKFEFLRVFPKVFSGAHVHHPAVKIMRGKSVEMTSDSIAYADGERIGPLPIDAKIVPSALLTWAM